MATSPGLSRRNFALLCLIIIGIWYTCLLSWSSDYSFKSAWKDISTSSERELSKHKVAPGVHEPIPNILHYVWLARTPDAGLKFSFRHFVSIYSAHVYLRPEIIYIHTDLSDEALEEAMSEDQEDVWTRLVFGIPNIEINKVVAPTETNTGNHIGHMEHRSDFVRTVEVGKTGGIYFDWDIYALRDFKPLRTMGFANVCGLEKGGLVNNGLFMSVKDSALLKLMDIEAHNFFDGGWSSASTRLLAMIARKLTMIPNEVIILEQAAWAPGSWEPDDARHMFEQHWETPKWGENSDTEADVYKFESMTSADVEEVWAMNERHAPWQEDFMSSYAIHGFKCAEVDTEGFTPENVLARQSNFARAVYPVVKHAIEEGLIENMEP